MNRTSAALVAAATLALPALQAIVVQPDAHEAARVRCAGLVATIIGTRGNDVLTGTPGHDIIAGLGGADHIDGGGGRDVLCGGHGNDTMTDGDSAVTDLYGGSGDDHLKTLPHSVYLTAARATTTSRACHIRCI